MQDEYRYVRRVRTDATGRVLVVDVQRVQVAPERIAPRGRPQNFPRQGRADAPEGWSPDVTRVRSKGERSDPTAASATAGLDERAPSGVTWEQVQERMRAPRGQVSAPASAADLERLRAHVAKGGR